MSDKITDALHNLKSELPKSRLNLTEVEKDQLVARVGPRTARSIVNAKKDYALSRIPFLFSSVDTQCVVDLLGNDMERSIDRALAKLNAGKSK